MAPADAARRGQLLVAAAAVRGRPRAPCSAPSMRHSATQVVGARGRRRRRRCSSTSPCGADAGRCAAFRSVGRAGLVVAVSLAIVSSVFIFALAHTTVAHVLLFQAIAPFLAALLAWVIPARARSRRAPGWRWRGARGRRDHGRRLARYSGGLLGDALCVVMSSGFALVIVITRRHREISMTPATALGMAIAFVAMAPFSHLGGVSARRLRAARRARRGPDRARADPLHGRCAADPAAQAGLITLIEVVLGPLWVWLIYREHPDTLDAGGRLGHRRRRAAARLPRAAPALRDGPGAGRALGRDRLGLRGVADGGVDVLGDRQPEVTAQRRRLVLRAHQAARAGSGAPRRRSARARSAR